MKKNQFRKLLVVFIISIMLLNMSVFAAENDTYEVTGTSEESGSIREDDVFIYNLTIDNKTANPITDVIISVTGDFSVVSGANLEIASLASGLTERAIPLTYSGSGDDLNILVQDASGDDSILFSTTIANTRATGSSSSSGDTNTDKYFPTFSLDFGSTPTFYAGQKKTLSFEIKNTSTYSGKDVQVKIIADDDSPFMDINNGLLTNKTTIAGNDSKTVSMTVETKAGAKSGYYTVPVEIISKNVYGVSQTKERNIQVEVVNNNVLPNVVISDLKIKNEILTPGQDDTILLELKNIGTLDIKNMNVSLEGTKINEITLVADSSEKQIKSIDAKKTDFVTFNVNVSDKLDVDRLELTLKLDYFDENGGSYTQTVPVYLDILQQGSGLYDYGFEVTSLPSAVVPGDEFKIKYNLTNNSQVTQEDLKLTLSSDGNFVFKSQPIIIVNEIAAGETQSFEYTLIANKDMASNNYPTYITLESLHNSDISRKEYLGVFVSGENNKNSKPKIIVDNYNFGKDMILAGETFDLEVTFFNTSNTMGIQNAKVSISSDEGAFVPVNTSSSFYIENIAVKEMYTHTMTFKAKSDLNVRTYNIIADIEYEDSNGNSYDKSDNPYVANEKMAIPVMQELRLEVEEINVPEMMPVFQPYEIYVEFFNMGKSPLENMMVTTSGDFEITDGKFFVGSFNAGSNEYYSCTIMPMVEGPQEGVIKFEYEDAVGEKHSFEKTFAFEAFPQPEQTDMEFPGDFEGGGEFPMEEDTKGFPWIPVVIVIVIIGVVVVIIKKKMQKKKEMALDE